MSQEPPDGDQVAGDGLGCGVVPTPPPFEPTATAQWWDEAERPVAAPSTAATYSDVARSFVAYLTDPSDFTAIDLAADALAKTLLSHLAYEESQLVEPLARYGFYAGQV